LVQYSGPEDLMRDGQEDLPKHQRWRGPSPRRRERLDTDNKVLRRLEP
jgi:hypothetical protein